MLPVNSNLQTLIDSDIRRPVIQVTAFDTTKTVPSKFCNVSYFALAPGSTITGEWYSGISGAAPTSNIAEGTFLTGNTIIEPSTVLAFDWGVGGVPSPVTGRTDLWAVRWYGHFYARYAGVYRFYIDSSPFSRVQIRFNSSVLTLKDSTDMTTERWGTDVQGTDAVDTREELYADTSSLTEGIWYAISIEFRMPKLLDPQNMPTYLCVKYKEPDDTTAHDLWDNTGGDIVTDYPSDSTEKKPLSAGVVNTTGGFLTGNTVAGIKSLRGTRRAGMVTEYEMEIALAASTNLTAATSGGEGTLNVESTDGFPSAGALNIVGTTVTYTGKTSTTFTGCSGVQSYSDEDLVAQDAGDAEAYNPLTGEVGDLKPMRLVRIQAGFYDGTSTDYFADRIWGIVYPGPQLNRKAKTITVRIRDAGVLLTKKYERNQPDFASYSMAGYYSKYTAIAPDGVGRPQCYDRWDSGSAIRDILIRGGVDPVLLYQRERYQISDTPLYASDYGRYLITGGLMLDSRPRYGRPVNIEGDNEDDEYLWAFGYGTYLYENLAEIVRSFGYVFSFTPEGYARVQSFGIPDEEYAPGDSGLTFTGSGWSANQADLSAFKARYRESSTAADKAVIAATYFDDLDIIVMRHSGASQKIKVKIGSTYQTQLVIDGVTVDGTGGGSDEFDITRSLGDWSFYDGADAATGVNPAVIKLAAAVTYASQAVEVEVVSGAIRVNAFHFYKRGTRSVIRSIGNDLMGDLNAVQDVESQRNEIDVIGAKQGQMEVSGHAINPNNPIYVHTVSRAIDILSIYDESVDNYVGHSIPLEIFDERLLDQERADHMAAHTLLRYRGQAVTGKTSIVADPRLEPMDSINLTDEHSRMLDDTQVWIRGISESMTVDEGADRQVSYVTMIDDVDPREPMPSMRSKPEPNIADFDNWPIVNLELHFQGKRIAGDDASYVKATKIATIASSPGWTTNMWAGYYFIDGKGVASKIAFNTADTVTFKTPFIGTFNATTWCISFDPLDAEALGAPIEILFDQTVNAKVKASIIANNGTLIANLNPEYADIVAPWGESKRLYWSGVIHGGYKAGKVNYYAGPKTLQDYVSMMPLSVHFQVRYQDGTIVDNILSHSTNSNPNSKSQYVLKNNISTDSATRHPRGGAKIIPKSLDEGYYIGVTAPNNLSTGEVIDAGRLRQVEDLGGDSYKLWIEGRGTGGYDPFVADEFNGKYVISGKSGISLAITDSGPDAGGHGWLTVTVVGGMNRMDILGFTGKFSLEDQGYNLPDETDNGQYPWLKIVENQYYPISFKDSDNNGQGLALSFTAPEFHVEGLSPGVLAEIFQDGIRLHQGTSGSESYLEAKYQTSCDHELTIHYDGTPYTVDAGSAVKLAQLGDKGQYPYSSITGDYIIRAKKFKVYWSKHYPTKLFFSAGRTIPDTNQPSEGIFVIAEIQITAAPGIAIVPLAPSVAPKARTFLMLPTLEIHQLSKHQGSSRWQIESAGDENILQPQQAFLPLRDMSLSVAPRDIQQEELSSNLPFIQNLRDASIPDAILWHFLVKMIIHDRMGRLPLNMSQAEDWLEVDVGVASPDDFEGINAFRVDNISYTATNVLLDTWLALRNYGLQLNIGRALPLWGWE